MPWHVEQGGGTCAAGEWAVIKDSDGTTAGCHPTKEKAMAQVAALYANDTPARQQRRQDVIPAGAARSLAFPSQLRAEDIIRDGKQLFHIHGQASVYDQLYEMYDVFGSYQEGVRGTAGAASLAGNPDVVFLANHRGISMARTVASTLDLRETDGGLEYDAYVNAERQDVRDLVSAIRDGTITESSFAFMIEEGTWNDDYTEYWIERYDINRGDVSAVNYGANPYTSVAARSREVLADLDRLPAGAARAALERLNTRADITPTGRSIALEMALLRLEEA